MTELIEINEDNCVLSDDDLLEINCALSYYRQCNANIKNIKLIKKITKLNEMAKQAKEVKCTNQNENG